MVILLVEDHEDSRRATGMLLKMLGHEVVPAAGASAALAAIAQRTTDGQPHFDVALIDLGLAETSGIELMSQMKQRCATRGIALTGRTGAEDVDQAMKAGFCVYLAKPVSVEQLEKALSDAMS